MTPREDRERIAKGLMAYKRELCVDREAADCEYAELEMDEVDDLARRLELERDYYTPGRLE